MSSTARLVTRYAEGFTARYATGHAVTSPLGAWLLLALAAPAASGPDRAALEEHLGTDATDAHRRAAELLARPHPAVHAAAAVWSRDHLLNESFTAWRSGLPPQVEVGDVPDQAGADAWARRRTRDMIDRFPVALDGLTAVVLASALATEVTWVEPFTAVPAAELGGPLARGVDTVLATGGTHRATVVDTVQAGRVGVLTAAASEGVLVIGVVAGEGVPAAAVHAAAGSVAALLTGGDGADGDGAGAAREVDPWALATGQGAAWSVTDSTATMVSTQDRVVTTRAVLPAWTATSSHDLVDAPGVAPVAATLDRLLRDEARPGSFAARQSATATYSRTGFRAAAVTAMAMRASAAPSAPRTVRHRELVVRFGRPHAVVAMAVGDPTWHGIPVFNAWVADAVDA